MRILKSLILPVVALSSGPGLAQSAPQSTPQPSPKPVLEAERVICEKEEDTGSRLSGRRVCHTREQWDQMRRDDRSTTERAQTQRTLSAPGK